MFYRSTVCKQENNLLVECMVVTTLMFFDDHDEGLWAESQTSSKFKSKSEQKGKARKYLKCESLKKMPVYLP